jgi:hypothetical protein
MRFATTTLRRGAQACAALMLLALPAHATILGISSAFVWRIDETTATDVLINSSGPAGLQAMAKNSAGVLYASGIIAFNHLYTIDPVTGAHTQGPLLPFTVGAVRALAFNGADVLYAANGNVAPFQLFTLDVTTGVPTLIGNLNGLISGMTFSSTGTLYGWDAGGAGLVTINPATGAITDVDAANGGGTEVQTLAFSPGGVLYGAGPNNLYTIDTNTGALTLVGAFNPPIGIFGMEFVSGAPPAAPAVAFTPPSVAFGDQQLGTTSASRAVTLQNVGNAALNIAAIAASGDFAQTNNCGATLAVSASCTISVTFTPSTAGARNGSVSVTSDAPGSPHSAALSGNGATVPPPPPPPPPMGASEPISTLSQWALALLALSVAGIGWAAARRPRR